MAEKKQALLLFSKPPVPGMVKTRLTTEHDGFLSPAQAAEFFKRSLYDVSELAMHALMELQMENDAAVAADPSVDKVTYDFFVSTTPAENVELMKETYDAIGPWPMEIHYMTDKGATFDDHFDYAFKEIFAQGLSLIHISMPRWATSPTCTTRTAAGCWTPTTAPSTTPTTAGSTTPPPAIWSTKPRASTCLLYTSRHGQERRPVPRPRAGRAGEAPGGRS